MMRPPDDPGPRDIAIDEAGVYFADELTGAISKIPKTGGVIDQLACSPSPPTHLAVDTTGVYWTASGLPDLNSNRTSYVWMVPK